jgi:hypothetical protein
MLASLQQRKHANGLAAEKTAGVPTKGVELPPQDVSTCLLSGFTPETVYSTESYLGGSLIPDPLYPSWLTDFQFDGAAFLSGSHFAHFS